MFVYRNWVWYKKCWVDYFYLYYIATFIFAHTFTWQILSFTHSHNLTLTALSTFWMGERTNSVCHCISHSLHVRIPPLHSQVVTFDLLWLPQPATCFEVLAYYANWGVWMQWLSMISCSHDCSLLPEIKIYCIPIRCCVSVPFSTSGDAHLQRISEVQLYQLV